MNSNLTKLHPYPFQKMALLLANSTPAENYPPIKLGIGEPKHPAPQIVLDELIHHIDKVQYYPTTAGLPELSITIADWLQNRFQLSRIDAKTEVVPVMGTREAIFSFIQASIDTQNNDTDTVNGEPPIIVIPNPFYQIYEGGALLAEAQPYYVPCTPENNFNADYSQIPEDVWQRTQLLFACSPNNPTGSVISKEEWLFLLAMADKYNFILASDECYSELYFAQPPIGLLEMCAKTGRNDYKNCVVFHSLSKRSNLPGLRSGFIAGDASLLAQYMNYRTYQGCAMPIHHQYASIKAWQDEEHVEINRQLYRAKFALWMNELGDVLDLRHPDAGFYFWIKVPAQFDYDDEKFITALYEQVNIHALAGRYLSRSINDNNCGQGYVRLALVASIEESREAIDRIKSLLNM